MRHLLATISLAAVLLLQTANANAQDDHARHTHAAKTRSLGHVSFPNSGNAQAQKSFVEGVALIHSFEYDDAVDAFEEARRADGKFALPYWMEALTNSQLIWGIDDVAGARAVLSKLGPTSQVRLARARNPGERAFGAAVEAFYSDGTEQSRATAFADALRKWVADMPDDLEAHAFAALGIIWQALYADAGGVPRLRTEAAKHAQYVFDRNPLHPGAAHYIIHASDAPSTAKLGLRAALEYSRIAPDAEHALHMPSHIFLPLGMWDELVSSNERAWKASRADAKRQGFEPWKGDFHSLNWLQYAYLQQGRWKEARALIDSARIHTKGIADKINPAEDPDASFATEQLAFRYASETGDWSSFDAEPVGVDLSDSTISQRARSMATMSVYQRAMVALKTRRDSTAVRLAIPIVRRMRPGIAGMRPGIAGMLEAEIVALAGDNSKTIDALEKLRPLTRVDRNVTMVPSPTTNVDEVLGEALVAGGRAADAIKVYRESLADRPRRAASLLGLLRAQQAAGDKAGARATYAELSKIWARADPEVKEMLRSTK